jgi:hypothetical protein
MSVISYNQNIEQRFNDYEKITKLTRNLAFAKEAMSYVNSVLPLGSYNLSNTIHSEKFALGMTMMREEWMSKFRDRDLKTESAIYNMIAEFSKKYRMGNCFEMTCVAYCFLKYTKYLIKVDNLSILGGDHTFNVIGRNPASDEKDPLTWGIETVVCDCWTNQYYPASEIFERMHSFNGRILFDRNIHTFGFKKDHKVPLQETLKCLYSGGGNKLEYAKLIYSNLNPNSNLDNITALCLQEYIDIKSRVKQFPSFEATLQVKKDFF